MLAWECTHTENGLYSDVGYVMAQAVKSVILKKNQKEQKKQILKIMMRKD